MYTVRGDCCLDTNGNTQYATNAEKTALGKVLWDGRGGKWKERGHNIQMADWDLDPWVGEKVTETNGFLCRVWLRGCTKPEIMCWYLLGAAWRRLIIISGSKTAEKALTSLCRRSTRLALHVRSGYVCRNTPIFSTMSIWSWLNMCFLLCIMECKKMKCIIICGVQWKCRRCSLECSLNID